MIGHGRIKNIQISGAEIWITESIHRAAQGCRKESHGRWTNSQSIILFVRVKDPVKRDRMTSKLS